MPFSFSTGEQRIHSDQSNFSKFKEPISPLARADGFAFRQTVNK
jgi:hypothetical protein